MDLDRAARRIDYAAELHQEAVTHHLEDAPTVLGDGRIEELPSMLPKEIERVLFVDLHKTAIADHICGQDRRQSTLNMLLRHVVS